MSNTWMCPNCKSTESKENYPAGGFCWDCRCNGHGKFQVVDLDELQAVEEPKKRRTIPEPFEEMEEGRYLCPECKYVVKSGEPFHHEDGCSWKKQKRSKKSA